MKRILFQGDSITDGWREIENITNSAVLSQKLGLGYPGKVASMLALDEPCKYEFFNRGVCGNRVVDVYARIKCDIINLEPDYMSILIGANDVWHEFDEKNGVDAEKFERVYDMLLEEVMTALPNIKIMLIEPFILPESATMGELEDGREKYDVFRAEIEKRAEATKRLAQKHNLVFMPLQEKFDELTKIQPVAYWSADGVHPTNVGHEFLAREWIKCFQENF